jgi:hypothetical protein
VESVDGVAAPPPSLDLPLPPPRRPAAETTLCPDTIHRRHLRQPSPDQGCWRALGDVAGDRRSIGPMRRARVLITIPHLRLLAVWRRCRACGTNRGPLPFVTTMSLAVAWQTGHIAGDAPAILPGKVHRSFRHHRIHP